MEILVALGFICVAVAIIFIPRNKDKEEIPPVTTSGTPRSEPRRMKRE